MKTRSHIFGTLAALALCLIIPACGGGGGGDNGGGGGGETSSGSSSSGTEDSGTTSSGIKQQIFIPKKYPEATLNITCGNFKGTLILGRGITGNDGTLLSEGEIWTQGTSVTTSGTLDGTWTQVSSTEGIYNVNISGKLDGGARLTIKDMQLKHSGTVTGKTVSGTVVAGVGTIKVTFGNGFVQGFGSELPLQGGTFTLTYN